MRANLRGWGPMLFLIMGAADMAVGGSIRAYNQDKNLGKKR